MSTERAIESIVIAALKVAPLDTVLIRHHDDEGDTITPQEGDPGPSRIVVKCDPPTPHIPARKASLAPAIYEAQVTVSAFGCYGEKDATEFDTWAENIDALISPVSPDTYPTAALDLAVANFPKGLEFDTSTQGSRWAGSADTRTRTRTFRAIFQL